jgi:bifunctional (S)-malyl-CoA lyase/thioesterase
MTGIWALTPGQVVEANRGPLPPATGHWLLDDGREEVTLDAAADADGVQVYRGDRLSLSESGEDGDGDEYVLSVGGETRHLDADELHEELVDRAAYVPGLGDIVDAMEEFEAAKEAGRGAIAITQSTTVRIDGVDVAIERDRMWDEATYQAAGTPIALFQDVYEHRPDQHDELADRYGEDVVERATNVGA